MNPLLTRVLLAAGLLFATVPALAGPTDNLLRLVGRDVGLCLELPRARTQVEAFRRSELFARLEQSQLYARWGASRHVQKLQRVRGALEQLVGMPANEFLGGLFGDAVVVAVYPLEGKEPAGVLLTETASEAFLESTIAAWNRAEPHETVELTHEGRTYHRRTRLAQDRRPAETHYYVQLGRLFALSDREAAIQRVLRLHAQPADPAARADSGESLLGWTVYETAHGAVSPQSTATAFINPRAWDSSLDATGQGAPLPVLRAAWERCEWIALGVRTDGGVTLEAVAGYDGRGASPHWAQLVEQFQQAPQFLERVPRSALFVMSGRVDLAGIEGPLQRRLSRIKGVEWKSLRQIARGLLLGLDPLTDILPALGENWALYVVPRETDSVDAIPLDALLAIELPPPADGEGGHPSLRAALDNGLNTAFNLLSAVLNGETEDPTAVVRSDEQESATVRWIDSTATWNPAYAILGDALVFAGSPALARKFASLPEEDRLTTDAAFAAWARDHFPRAGQVTFLNLARLRAFVAGHRGHFTAHLEATHSVSGEEAARRLAELEDALTLADGLFSAIELDNARLRFVAGVAVAAKPEAADR